MRHKKESFLSKLKNAIVTLLLTCVMLFWVQGYTNASGLRFVQVSDSHFLNNGANTTFKMIAESRKLLDDAVEQINSTPNVDFVMFTGDLIDAIKRTRMERMIRVHSAYMLNFTSCAVWL